MDDVVNSGSASHILTADVEGLLDFFDEKPDWSVGHATGVVGIVGEDLNTACLQHYLASKGGSATVFRHSDTGKPLPVTTGRTKGPRLDRWIRVEWPDRSTTVFQTEIKSWSAHAIGGMTLSLMATQEQLSKHKQIRWERQWDSERCCLRHPQAVKVLVPMNPPKDVVPEAVQPLIIFWEALGLAEASDDHLFRVKVADGKFQELWVFSVSGYLRSLLSEGVPNIELEMPDAALRLRSLNRLFSG